MAGSIRARLSRLEARVGSARGDGTAGAIIKRYVPNRELPQLTSAERAAAERGSAVFWIPDNGRSSTAAEPSAAAPRAA